MTIAAPSLHGIGVLDKSDPNTPDFSKMPPMYPYQVPTLLRRTAKKMAATFYDGMQRYEQIANATGDQAPIPFSAERTAAFRKTWKSEKLYVAWCWPMFVKTARATLAAMLGDPMIAEHMKKEIFACLTSEIDQQAFRPEIIEAIRGFAP